MKNFVSEQSLYIESEDEDEEKEFDKGEIDGYDSDFSNYSNESHQESKPSSVNTTWPQSYRQSIDLYSSVPSPSITFLGTPTLSRLSGSVLSSSLTRKHPPEILPSLAKPLLEDDEHQQRSSHSLLPPSPSRKTSIQKTAKVSHEVPVSRKSSYGQAVLNGMSHEPIFMSYIDWVNDVSFVSQCTFNMHICWKS
ncbi:transmembrane amino acid transporter family protein [Actinidia rufa]|uniref:Transmembrane amino acid transporter family protein n=1 Tax=Actinidia rufa TaxID=165716 RepID=A0A7J0GKA9_9ERIC|nr:transmembrane amino acid transporter family protein [Actinidia rufa]